MASATTACQVDLEAVERQIWRDAILLYNRDKTPKHRIVLGQAQADLQAEAFDDAGKLLEVAEQRCKELYETDDQSTRRRAISSILKEIRQYAPILDVFTQGAPPAVSVCWGVVRVVLEATTRGLQFGPELLDNICRILRQVSTFKRELVYLALNKQSFDSITRLYAALIEYLVRVSRHCKATRWRRAQQAWSTKLACVYDEIFRIAKEVESQVAADSFVSIGEFRAAQQVHNGLSLAFAKNSTKMLADSITSVRDGFAFQCDQHNQDLQIIDWLKTDLISDGISRTVEDGTCSWIQCDPNYCRWTSEGRSKSLWVRGPSGSGKTSLSFSLASHATESGQNVVLASVLQIGNFTQSPATNLVVSIIAKIVQHKAVIKNPNRRTILNLLADHRNFGPVTAVKTPTNTLISILRCILDLVPPLMLIVDGLDQLDNTSEGSSRAIAVKVISLLNQISSISAISLIVLSRPRAWISTNMKNTIQLDIPETITNDDIAIAIQNRVRQDPRLERLKDEIIRTAKSKASGDFMYATLLLDELEGSRSPSDQKSVLAAASPNTEATYRDLCTRKVANLRPKDQLRRSQIFQMVIGSRVPLSFAEINAALALDLVRNTELEDELLFDPCNDILDLGEPFLVINDAKVHFRHESARKYVLKSSTTIQDANTFLLNICLTKLIEDKYSSLEYCARLLKNDLLIRSACARPSMAGVTGGSGLYDHATRHWHEYALQLQQLPPELWEKLRIFLHGNAFVAWSENLYTVRNRTGLDGHLEVGVAIARWYKGLPDDSKPDISIDRFFTQPYEDISAELRKQPKEPELQYLPLIRIAGYLNNGGRTNADFEKALEVARKVVEGFTEHLGKRDRNTLNARLAYYQGILALRRPDEALVGYLDVLKIQQEIFKEDVIDIYRTWQWIGNCYRLLARFAESRAALETALEGFKRIMGERNKFVLFVALGLANTVEVQGNVDEAATAYSQIYNDWVSVNGISNLFSANIMTGYGSTLRKQGHYEQAQGVLFEAFATRIRLLTLANDTTVDSGLHLSVLYRQMGQREDALAFLTEIEGSESFDLSFERKCEREHIRALLAFDGGAYEDPRNSLTQLVMMSTGENRERNNRELLWVRLNLADAARDHDDKESIPSLFAELVIPIESPPHQTPPCRTPASDYSQATRTSVDDIVVLDTPKQLEIAEEALRLTRDKRLEEAARCLKSENLKWARDKDFWILGGGPKVDTDTVKYRLPRLPDVKKATSRLGSEGHDPIYRFRKLLASRTEAKNEGAFTMAQAVSTTSGD